MTVEQTLYNHSECLETYTKLKEGLSKRQKTSMESVSGSGYLHPGNAFPHSRSGSFRYPSESKSKQPVSDFQCVADDSFRRESFPPNTFLSISYDDVRHREGKESSLRRVRSFKTTTKGVVNRGDSFRKKGGRISGTTRDKKAYEPLILSQPRVTPPPEVLPVIPVFPEDHTSGSYFKVVVLGATGVGKSMITQQFMTSEYIAFDNSIDQDDDNTTVSVLLNGEESTLEFVDDVIDYEVELETMQADAYMVVFSIAHRDTYDAAIDMLHELRHGLGSDRAAILVGNKSDLVRKRKVKTEEALDIASQFDAKYTETSAALNHHVDELLVGMLSQIRFTFNPSLPEPVLHVPKKAGNNRRSFKDTFSFLSRIFGRGSKKNKPKRTNISQKDVR